MCFLPGKLSLLSVQLVVHPANPQVLLGIYTSGSRGKHIRICRGSRWECALFQMAAKMEPLVFLQDLPPDVPVSVPKLLPTATATVGVSGGDSSVPQLIRHRGAHGERWTCALGAVKFLPKR